MAKCKLFDGWTFARGLPKPFDDASVSKTSTTVFSKFSVGASKSTLHAATLRAIIAYADLELGRCEGAVGYQKDVYSVSEYRSQKGGQTHVIVYNKNSGVFKCGIFEDGNSIPKSYVLKDSKETGAALLFNLVSIAMEEEEFAKNYGEFSRLRDVGLNTDLEKATDLAYNLCDNIFRRIENQSLDERIPMSTLSTGNIPPLTNVNLKNGAYNPTSVIMGKFQILNTETTPKAASVVVSHSDFVDKYKISEREFNEDEKKLIPELPEWYVIPSQVISICKHIKETSTAKQPMKNFMLRGISGTGKTESAKAIAAGLGLPYLFYTCSANSEIFDLLGQYLPECSSDNTNDFKSFDYATYPTLEDIQMDPSTAYKKLTGTYIENISESEVYNKLIEVIKTDSKSEIKADSYSGSQKFIYTDTPLVKAIRNGYLIELQEPSIIANPGVLVGLNSILDRCSSITLPTGEIVKRHPNTIFIVTTNSDYSGCRNINQSVISRMDLIFDINELSIEMMVERAHGITGFTDISALKNMAETMKEIEKRCRETMITDGAYGFREFLAWVQSYSVMNDFLESAECTVLSSVSADEENRAEIFNTCLEPRFGL